MAFMAHSRGVQWDAVRLCQVRNLPQSRHQAASPQPTAHASSLNSALCVCVSSRDVLVLRAQGALCTAQALLHPYAKEGFFKRLREDKEARRRPSPLGWDRTVWRCFRAGDALLGS